MKKVPSFATHLSFVPEASAEVRKSSPGGLAIRALRLIRTLLTAEAVSKQVRHFDEQSATVAAETRDDGATNRIETVIQVVVIAGIKGGTRIRRPAQQEL